MMLGRLALLIVSFLSVGASCWGLTYEERLAEAGWVSQGNGVYLRDTGSVRCYGITMYDHAGSRSLHTTGCETREAR